MSEDKFQRPFSWWEKQGWKPELPAEKESHRPGFPQREEKWRQNNPKKRGTTKRGTAL